MATLEALENNIILRTIFEFNYDCLYDYLFVNKCWHEVALSLLLQDRKRIIYHRIDCARETLEWNKKYKIDILPNQQFIEELFYAKPIVHVFLELWQILTIIPNQLKKQIFPDFLTLQHEYEEYAYQNFWDRNVQYQEKIISNDAI
ncbi:hypothetical protein RCL_jg15944.t1 [Rhizophagus clarus]|uniref:Uncharacterized protein n=1 Tax=Rhizophagus clarus TaxID=94130 RepID=A0A8H3LCL8_9GLOM|nr:hypothetical protein RCL_jg15944.t1 [Rhizophagus clarus]